MLRNGRKEGQDDTGTEREEEAPLACVIKQPDLLGNQSSVLVASWGKYRTYDSVHPPERSVRPQSEMHLSFLKKNQKYITSDLQEEW